MQWESGIIRLMSLEADLHFWEQEAPMKARMAIESIRQAFKTPLPTWLEYTPAHTPIVVYDEDEFFFLNHPHPPTERPENLTAATALPTNGISTAALPASMCETEQALVPLTCHECFHVYQREKSPIETL